MADSFARIVRESLELLIFDGMAPLFTHPLTLTDHAGGEICFRATGAITFVISDAYDRRGVGKGKP